MTIQRDDSTKTIEIPPQRVPPRPSLGGMLHIEVAQYPEDLEAAFKLVYEHYRRLGYVREHHSRLRVTSWDALPGAIRLIAWQRRRVTGTLGLAQDSSIGLPLDEIAIESLMELRCAGRSLCEVSGLAMATHPYNIWGVMRMFRYALKIALEHMRATDLVFAVDPRDVVFYEGVLLCERLGPARPSSTLNGQQVVPMRLDLTTLQDTYREQFAGKGPRDLHDFFFVRDQHWLNVLLRTDMADLDPIRTQRTVNQLLETATESAPRRFFERTPTLEWDPVVESGECAATLSI